MFNVLVYISIFSVVIPLSCCVIKFSALNKELRALFLYIIISVTSEIVSLVLQQNQITNYIVQNLYTMCECTLITYIFLNRFDSNKSKLLIKIFYFIFVLIALIIFGFMKGINGSDNLVSTYESCFFILLAWAYFYKLMTEKNISKLNQFYFAWINTAILIYFSMAFISFLFNKFIGQLEMSLYALVYAPHLIINIAYNILLGIGVWKIKLKS